MAKSPPVNLNTIKKKVVFVSVIAAIKPICPPKAYAPLTQKAALILLPSGLIFGYNGKIAMELPNESNNPIKVIVSIPQNLAKLCSGFLA